jgi:hypothetical protein
VPARATAPTPAPDPDLLALESAEAELAALDAELARIESG